MKPVFLGVACLSALLITVVTGILIYLHIFEFVPSPSFYLLLFSISFAANYLLISFFITKRLQNVLRNINFHGGSDLNQKTSGDIINDINRRIETVSIERKNEVEQLRKLENYRKEFLGDVSHELKTPVFNIQGYILTLLDGGINDPAINETYLKRAENSVERMINIIDDLEAITRLETGELELEPERFDIAELITDVLTGLEFKASGKGVILSFYHKKENPMYVIADKSRIRQVLTNLIVNSIKYGKEYGETKVRCYDTGKNILVEVADNGIGISKDHLPRLFERFYRVDKSRSREQGGTGLGLSIVKHIIEAHDQKINVLSTEGAGSVFSFTMQKE